MELSKGKAIVILNSIYQTACDASLTGRLDNGANILVDMYNKIRITAITNKWIDEDWIAELKEGEYLNANVKWMDVVGTAAKMLISLITWEESDGVPPKIQ